MERSPVEAISTPGTGTAFVAAAGTVGSPTWRAFSNPPVHAGLFEDRSLLQAEIPGANGVGDALAVATLFAALVDPDEPLLMRATVDRMRAPVTDGLDHVLVGLPTRFGALFMTASPILPMLGPESFGHDGFGGAIGFADPVTGVGFAQLVVRPQLGTQPFPRTTRVVEAVRAAIMRGA